MGKSHIDRWIAEASGDFIVYPNHSRLAGWTAISGITTLCTVGAITTMIVLSILTPSMRDSTVPVSLLFLFLGGLAAAGIWQTLVFLRMTLSTEPVLIISRAGIRVGKIYGLSDLFLPWKDVETVSSQPPYKVLDIHPVNTRRFIASLPLNMRLICRLNVLTGAPVTISQSFMDKPIDEILEQIRRRYARELQLHPTDEREKDTSGTRQNIILYTPRVWLRAAAVMSLCLPPGVVILFLAHGQFSAFLASALFISLGITLGLLIAWRMLLIPVLLIDDEGIASPYLLKTIKIKWEEIAAISCITGANFSVDISPSGTIAFLARQNKGSPTIPRYVDITLPQTVLSIPQTMLPLSLDRLIALIRTRFQDQLNRYNIEVDTL